MADLDPPPLRAMVLRPGQRPMDFAGDQLIVSGGLNGKTSIETRAAERKRRQELRVPGEALHPETEPLADLGVESCILYRPLVDLERELGLDPLVGDWELEGSSITAGLDY